ncbi:alpha/beta hydrolase [Sutterella seckii]|uniref:alpha/beta hydrolase n=1 Tax=Sutterella seckii TaxID=1944635 RepID=UPI00299F8BD0|nr:alpha/beta hydrolase [Sutterella seckii]
MKAKLTAAALSVLMASAASSGAFAADAAGGPDNFYKSDRVTMEKVSFHNLYRMNVVGNLYLPKNADQAKALPAVIVGHPMGAVKEQSSNLYAQKLAEAGFAALAIDLSFWGESAGEPRQSVLPDVYSDDFSAAVDFLGTKQGIDRTKIGASASAGAGASSSAPRRLTRASRLWPRFPCTTWGLPPAMDCAMVRLWNKEKL